MADIGVNFVTYVSALSLLCLRQGRENWQGSYSFMYIRGWFSTKNIMNQTRYFVMRVRKVSSPTVICCSIYILQHLYVAAFLGSLRLLDSSIMSVRMENFAPWNGFSWNLIFENFWNSVEEMQVSLTLRRLMSYIYIWSNHSWCF